MRMIGPIRYARPCLAAVAALLMLHAAGEIEAQPKPGASEPIVPIPAPPPEDAAELRLGQALFDDPRLSHDGRFACRTCHDLATDGANEEARTLGADGRLLTFNAPTILNAALSFRLNWRGEFRTLEEQNEAVVLSPRLMATSWPELLAKLEAHPGYRTLFDDAYGAGPSRERVLQALAAFQRSLLTPGARFDRYLSGEAGAITAEERKGYELFKSYGCSACHQGVNVGGNLFQRFGIFPRPPGPRRPGTSRGRIEITGRIDDHQVFRVPSLRNVALTAPYLDDGRAATLAEAVTIMMQRQLGREAGPGDIALIIAFLETLTSRPAAALRQPASP